MTLEVFLEKLNQTPESVSFNETIETIESIYDFTPTAFQNGDTRNEVGQNSGSCKLFYFAQLQKFNQEQTLQCFGDFYRIDVLENPDASNHQNIRNFIKYGWEGISFEGEALKPKA